MKKNDTYKVFAFISILCVVSVVILYINKDDQMKSAEYYYERGAWIGYESDGVTDRLIFEVEKHLRKDVVGFWCETNGLIETDNLKNFPKLSYLGILNPVESVDSFKYMSDLEEVTLGDVSRVADFSAFENCKKLKEVWIWKSNLKNLKSFRFANELEVLCLESLEGLSEIQNIQKLENIRFLSLSCDSGLDLSPLTKCRKLENLYLDLKGDVNLRPLENCVSLEKVTFDSAISEEQLNVLTRMTFLLQITIHGNVRIDLLKKLKEKMPACSILTFIDSEWEVY